LQGWPRSCHSCAITLLCFTVALHLTGAVPAAERGLLEYPLEGNWTPDCRARFIRGGFTPDNEGRIKIPDGPGLGIEIDWEVIRRFGKRIFKGTNSTLTYHTLLDRGLKQSLYLKSKKKELLKRTEKAQFEIPVAPF